MNKIVTLDHFDIQGKRIARRFAVNVAVTSATVRSATNFAYRKVGRDNVHGPWYGCDLTDINSYGKTNGRVGLPTGGKVVGRPTPFMLAKLGARMRDAFPLRGEVSRHRKWR